MKTNLLALIICLSAMILALGTVAHATPPKKSIPADLLEIQPRADLVIAHRAKVARQENERQPVCRSLRFDGDGRTTIVFDCSTWSNWSKKAGLDVKRIITAK